MVFCPVMFCQGLVQWSHVVSRYSTIMFCGAMIRVKMGVL